MNEPIYVVDGARTPFLKSRNRPGPFAASDLATAAGRALLVRQRFGNPVEGSSKWRSMQYALNEGKLSRGNLGLSGFGNDVFGNDVFAELTALFAASQMTWAIWGCTMSL